MTALEALRFIDEVMRGRGVPIVQAVHECIVHAEVSRPLRMRLWWAYDSLDAGEQVAVAMCEYFLGSGDFPTCAIELRYTPGRDEWSALYAPSGRDGVRVPHADQFACQLQLPFEKRILIDHAAAHEALGMLGTSFLRS